MSYSETPTFTRNQGCATSVLISAFFTACGFGIFFMATGDGRTAAAAFTVALFGAILIIGLAAAAIGLPLTHILESNRWERPWSYPLAGFVFGGAIAYIFAEAIGEPVTLAPNELVVLLIGALPGALCGGLWWWFERRHAQRN